MLHAQASAVGFYRRLGWQPRGDAFEEAGITHQEMVLPL
jgi:predicted GNAT family N-acyltransferase